MNVVEIYFTPSRSYLAANIQAPTGLGSNIWVYDVARTLLSPLTTDTRTKVRGILSPDGRVAVYDAVNGGPGGWQDLYRQAVDKSSGEQLLFASQSNKRPTSWSPDGRFLLFSSASPGKRADLYVLPDPLATGTPAAPFLFMAEAGNGEFSPDGQFIAFGSGRVDATEVYVGRLQEPGRKRVSTRTGTQPQWRADGRELFYVEEDTRQIMAVDVSQTGNDLQFGTPHRLPIGESDPRADSPTRCHVMASDFSSLSRETTTLLSRYAGSRLDRTRRRPATLTQAKARQGPADREGPAEQRRRAIGRLRPGIGA